MRRRAFLKFAGMAPAFLTLSRSPAAKPLDKQPNILLINADDHRFDTIHALGNPDIKTPNLDRLAKRGFAFDNVYSQGGMISAMCLPSRTMLMTGLSLFHIPTREDNKGGNYPLLPKVMREAGYVTFRIGKRGGTDFAPACNAFDKNINSSTDAADRAQQSEIHADATIEFIRGLRPDQRFFACLAPCVPHDPRVAPKKFMDMYKADKIPLPPNFMPQHPFDNGDLQTRDEMLAPIPRTPELMRQHIADYYACITCLDFHIGRVLAALDETGLARNTIVIFTGDQGLAVGGRHGLMGKQNLYEHFKSPLIICGPGIPHGRSSALVYTFDLFSTICDLAGAKLPDAVEGSSLAPIVRGEKPQWREWLFAAYKDCQRMIRNQRFKFFWYPKIGKFQLFDLANDPWEINDLSEKAEFAATLAEMKKRLAEYQEKFDDDNAPRPLTR